MTMHRAKGLQFDHVVLFGLGRIPRPREQSVLSWFDIPDQHGRPMKVISPVGPRAELEKDRVHGYIGQVETTKDRNELSRLLYVACTRARKSLHLIGHARLLKSGMRPDKRSLLHLLWPAVQAEYERVYDPEVHTADVDDDGTWLIPELKRFADGWQLPDAPVAPQRVETRDDAAPEVEFYWVGTEARIAGTLVHRWAQHIVDRQIDSKALDDRTVRETTMRWAAGDRHRRTRRQKCSGPSIRCAGADACR